MNYWDIVLVGVVTLAVAALVCTYMWVMISSFFEGSKILGWVMAVVLVLAVIFGFPLVIMGLEQAYPA